MDRRAFLRTTTGRKETVSSSQSPVFSETPSLAPYTGPWDHAAITHLLRRATVAPTYAQMRAAESMTMTALVDQLVASPPSLPCPSRFVAECMNASAIYWDSGRTDIINTFFDELRRWWIGLMTNSPLQ